MTQVQVSVDLPVAPEKAWATVADLNRFDEWLTIHQGWRSELPAADEIKVGTRITEVVSVMGMANKVEWTVEEYEQPRKLRISGTGMAGVQISFTMTVEPEGEGSKAELDLEFTGQIIVGPIGTAIGASAKSELDRSLAQLAELVG